MRSCPKCTRLQADSMGFCPEDGARLGGADPLLGQTLSGQFVLQERIGQGGCGDVYRAYQLGVERPVAVKVLHSGAARVGEFATRFAREARAAARLSHPNIVTVFQLGASEEGLPYIAMEWADARPIGRGTESLSHRDVLLAATQIASALGAAHDIGIIHRDLKPENVLLGTRGGALHVTLVDFGIAKIVNAELMQSGETHLTRHGVVYGTPQYLSPEQAGGQPVDVRSDLYSFGVMLYELFAGRLPFEGQGMALLVDHLTTTPQHIASIVPDLDPRVASLVMRMLEKSPRRRPASAQEVHRELQAALMQPTVRIPSRSLLAEHAPPHKPVTGNLRLGLMVALLLWLASSTSLGTTTVETAPAKTGVAANTVLLPVHSDESPAEPVETQTRDDRGESSFSTPKRALLLSSGGYSMRVLMPEYLGANERHPLAVELWDSGGEPVRSDALVLVFTDASGQEQGVSVAAGTVPGRYEIDRSFEREGTHAMQVLPERGGVSLRVHFDVAAEAPPNT